MESILQKTNFLRENLLREIRKNLIIDSSMPHYPNNPHTKYYDWNWCKDEFVPPLTRRELALYIRHPRRFRKDLLDNLKLYILFCGQVKKQVPKIKQLPEEDTIVFLLVLLFLFQSAMDNHYYRYDYVLDLEEYAKSPLGYHYLRMCDIVQDQAKRLGMSHDHPWVNENLLILLSKRGQEVVRKFKRHLDAKSLRSLQESYGAMQIYLKVQQEEERLFYGKNKNGMIFQTGFSLWHSLNGAVTESPAGLFRNKKELQEILGGDPIVGTRKILVRLDSYFTKGIVSKVKQNVKKWQ